ncbi:MAG: O-acetyl-ADP-ribose deacetylase [Firmicutes bacterium]|nr:O-acetyl-ADP-ribose deacetylase [Bacillota bacterium]
MSDIRHRIAVYQGNITKMGVDAIVNAANTSLLGGGGVDGAIHAAAGPGLLEECRELGGCPVGQAKITGGYDLPAPYVIHTVGPIWRGGDKGEARKLACCYYNSLKLASEYQLATIAFPAISTGVYGYPKEQAAAIAVKTVAAYLEEDKVILKVYFVAFDRETEQLYQNELARL